MEALRHYYEDEETALLLALLEEPLGLQHVGYHVHPKRAPLSAQTALHAGGRSDRRGVVGLSKVLRNAGLRSRDETVDTRYVDD